MLVRTNKDSPCRRDGAVFSLKMMPMSPTLCYACNVFAGSIFCWCRCTCKATIFYPNSCLFLFGYSTFNTNLTMHPNTLLHYRPEQRHRAIMPLASTRGFNTATRFNSILTKWTWSSYRRSSMKTLLWELLPLDILIELCMV